MTTVCCETNWVAAVRGFADRGVKTRQTRRSPTHSRHNKDGRRRSAGAVCDGCGINSVGLRNPIAVLSDRRTISGDLSARNGRVGRAQHLQPKHNQCGSRACPRWRCISQHQQCLTHRHRGQARLPQGSVVCLRGRSDQGIVFVFVGVCLRISSTQKLFAIGSVLKPVSKILCVFIDFLFYLYAIESALLSALGPLRLAFKYIQ